MSSRERNTKLIVQNKGLASYVSGVGMNMGPMNGVKSRAGGIGSGGMRHPHGYLNRKASEEKFQNNQGLGVGQLASGGLYSGQRKGSIDQHRYKSHLRGQENPHNVGLIRNPSKPTLQLPEINSSSMIGGSGGRQNMQQINDMSNRSILHDQMSQQSHNMASNQRSKKSLHGGGGSIGHHMPIYSPSHLAYNLP